jgi:hypothetical protein
MHLLCKLGVKIKSYITFKKNGKTNVGSRWEEAKEAKTILHVKQHMERELETTKENNKEFHKEFLTNIKLQLHGKKEKMDT